jgi:signal peptidase I
VHLEIKKVKPDRNRKQHGYRWMYMTRWCVTGILFATVIGLVFCYTSPNFRMAVVRSESMTPCIEMGDIIITARAGGTLGTDIKPGKVVSYKLGKSVVTHRVISVNQEDGTFETKGDAVKIPDPQLVTPSQVEGIYLFRLPKLGYLTFFMHTKMGWYLTVILPTAILVGFIVREIVKESLKVEKHQTPGR